MSKKWIYVLFIVLFFNACQQDKEQPPKVKLIKLKTHLFYKDLFETPIDSVPNSIPTFIQKYSPFFELFTSNVIHIGYPEEQRCGQLLQQFVGDFRMRQVFNEIKAQFADLKPIDSELQQAFSYFAYYFPQKAIPQIYYYHGGFNQSVITTDSMVGIGLDKYLGEKYEFYLRLGLPEYQRKKMYKAYIPVDVLRYYLYGLFPFETEQDNVLAHIIYEGKIQVLLDKLLPALDDTLKFGFSSQQLVWCENSERSMWQYLIDKKMLFSTNLIDIKRYTNDGPFTTTFPRQSPARAAVWLGYRIVKQYMKKNTSLTLEELMNEKDAQKIIQYSEYNP